MTDPIADFLTRIRNAVSVGHKVVEIPGSKMKLEMTKILKEKGYVIARRTVAKYREQLGIPVARLRKEI